MAGAYLWRIYLRIRRRVGSNGFGSNPVSLGDIAEFIWLFRFPLAPWEIEVIEELDDLYLMDQSQRSRNKTTPKEADINK